MTIRAILTGVMLLLGLLLAVVSASPIDPAIAQPQSRSTETSLNITSAADQYGIVRCGYYTYENQNSGGSPLIKDCQQIVANIQGDAEWQFWEGGQHEVVRFGTCAVGVEPSNGHTAMAKYFVGNGDMITIINDAISNFGIDGIIGAKGGMKCKRQALYFDGWLADVTWGIYHT